LSNSSRLADLSLKLFNNYWQFFHFLKVFFIQVLLSHSYKRIHRLLIGKSPPALFWLSSHVASHRLAVAPHSGAKQTFYCTVYYINLNSNCEA
jgi:hypothetical protein